MAKSVPIEMIKLKNIQTGLEKPEPVLKNILSQGTNVIGFMHKLEEDRLAEVGKVQTNVLNLLEMLQEVKLKVVDYRSTDIKELHNEMVTIQAKINEIQLEARKQLLNLEEEESDLFELIKGYSEQIGNWSKPIKIDTKIFSKEKTVLQQKTPVVRNLTPKHELCGWSLPDHNIFLKMKQKYKNPNEFLSILLKILPDKTQEDIFKHKMDYQKCLDLKKKQKEQINNWKEQKKKLVVVPLESNTIANNNNKKVIIKQDTDIKGKLLAWKKEKEQRVIQEKEFELEEENRRKQSESTKKMKNKIVKKEVEIWRLEKLAGTLEQKAKKEKFLEKEKELRACEANRLIKEYQHQDEAYIRRMREIRLSQKKKTKLFVNRVTAEKDPSRLLKPTKQWMSRISDNKYHREELFLQNVPKLGIPHWRKHSS